MINIEKKENGMTVVTGDNLSIGVKNTDVHVRNVTNDFHIEYQKIGTLRLTTVKTEGSKIKELCFVA